MFSFLTLILDILTLGLYSQYLLCSAPIGFQSPASLAFNNIIDFHDYIIIFLVFIFVLVIWHLVWALNLYRTLASVLYVWLILVCIYRFVCRSVWLLFQYPVINKMWFHNEFDLQNYSKFLNFFVKEGRVQKTILFIAENTTNSQINIINAFFNKLIVFLSSFVFLVHQWKSHKTLTNFLFFYSFSSDLKDLSSYDNSLELKVQLLESSFSFEQFLLETKRRVEYTKTLFASRYLLHAPSLEIFWTIFPSFILLAIAVPSLILLYQLDAVEPMSLCVKVIGHQWYWTYEIGTAVTLFQDLFPARKAVSLTTFDSYMLTESASSLRLLEVDNPLYIPVNTPITFLITSADVLHSWAVPSLGIKVDAIPGRLNQVGITINELGIFYGQCSELCGINHGFMPINVISFF